MNIPEVYTQVLRAHNELVTRVSPENFNKKMKKVKNLLQVIDEKIEKVKKLML